MPRGTDKNQSRSVPMHCGCISDSSVWSTSLVARSQYYLSYLPRSVFNVATLTSSQYGEEYLTEISEDDWLDSTGHEVVVP